MASNEIVAALMNMRPSDEAVAWLAALIADPAAVEGVNELSRRYGANQVSEPLSVSGRYTGATTVRIDPGRWSAFFFRRRLPLNAVGSLFNRCSGWASVIKKKGHAGFYALDDLATALDMRVNDLIFEVGTDEERQRLAAF